MDKISNFQISFSDMEQLKTWAKQGRLDEGAKEICSCKFYHTQICLTQEEANDKANTLAELDLLLEPSTFYSKHPEANVIGGLRDMVAQAALSALATHAKKAVFT